MYKRYDGRMTKAKRNLTLSTFAQEASVKVILVSITCGGQKCVLAPVTRNLWMTCRLDPTDAKHGFLSRIPVASDARRASNVAGAPSRSDEASEDYALRCAAYMGREDC